MNFRQFILKVAPLNHPKKLVPPIRKFKNGRIDWSTVPIGTIVYYSLSFDIPTRSGRLLSIGTTRYDNYLHIEIPTIDSRYPREQLVLRSEARLQP